MSDDATRMLADRYEVGALIGRGGMAEVHIGRDTRLGRTVAIKVLRSDLARDPTFHARFRREAQSAASLNHPAIVSVYDTGEDVSVDAAGVEHRVPFIVMEYVEGHTVRDLLRDGEALPIEEALEITAGVLSALEYSHRAGIVHRDIKPANVMLTPTGDIKVMDFGIARAMADASGGMTQTQAVVGTAQYLSPEQARGEVVDTRSDLYSTGCLLYELLTGRPPFVGESAVSIAYQHVGEMPKAPSELAPDVPDEVDRIVMTALTKDKEQRYQSAAQFRSDLEAASHGGPISAPAMAAPTTVLAAAPPTPGVGTPSAATQVFGASSPPTSAEPAGEDEDEPKRSNALIWILVVLAVIAAGAAVYLLVLNNGSDDGTGEETTTSATPTQELVDIPSLEGLDEEGVRDALTEVGLDPEFQTPEPSDDIAEGLFVRATPEPGQSVDISDPTNTTVQVWMSAGPNAIAVPEIQGLSQEEARQRLSNAGFDAVNITVRSENIPGRGENEADGTEPAAGETIAPDADITLVLGTGLVDLPDLIGTPEADMQTILSDLELGYDTLPPVFSDNVPAGSVAEQDPGPGSVPIGSRVQIVISQGPEPTPEPTTAEPTPEPTTEEPTEEPTETPTEGEEQPTEPDEEG